MRNGLLLDEKDKKTVEDLAKVEVNRDWFSPLEYLLALLNDVGTDDRRRDSIAIALLPYVHGRAYNYSYKGKKAQMIERAQEAGGEWGDLLDNEKDEGVAIN